jgi:Bifunctional DNA primase/polymerase, N-terminal
MMSVPEASDAKQNGRQAPGARPRRLQYLHRVEPGSPNGVNPVYQAALEAHEAGINAIPASEDGKKRPFGGSAKWKVWQTKRTYPAQLKRWFADGHRSGVGIVTGAISGNLEMLEMEGRAIEEGVYDAFMKAAEKEGHGELIERIRNGYEERTPSEGLHWLCRCEEISGNLKLAQRPATEEELAGDPNSKIKPLIETRGEGGFVVCAPSGGPTHETGKSWVRLQGGFDTIVTISPEEREDLHTFTRRFDQMPVKKTTTSKQKSGPRRQQSRSHSAQGSAHDRPGDDFNGQASWSEILEPHGWSFLTTQKDDDTGIEVGYWCRPGKTKQNSACTNHEGTDTLKVFSTSTPFDIEGTHSKFDAYALLNHDGDYEAAAADLGKQGYGSPPSSRDWRFSRTRTDPVGEVEGEHRRIEAAFLPDEFWNARPVLQHIRQAAYSRGRSPAAVLNNVLARAGAMLPHTLKLPAIVGSEVCLSFYAVNLSRPGTGRSGAIDIATELLPWPHDIDDLLPIGSGEGLYDWLFAMVEIGTNAKNKPIVVRQQVHHNAIFSVDEGQLMTALTDGRSGSTLIANLCSAFTGGSMGSGNVEAGGRRRRVPAGSYNLGLMVTFQDLMVKPLIEQMKSGFPQRFNWADAIDADIPPPNERPVWPGPLGCKLPDDEHLAPLAKRVWQGNDPVLSDDGVQLLVSPPVHMIPVAQSVTNEIATADWNRSTGRDAEEERAHWYLKREKAALALAWVTESRLDINEEDWKLAGMVSKASDDTFARIQAVFSVEEAETEYKQSTRLAKREVRKAEELAVWRTVECARKIRAKVNVAPGRTKKDLRSSLRRWRGVLDDGLDHALERGWIVPKNVPTHTDSDTKKFYPGEGED